MDQAAAAEIATTSRWALTSPRKKWNHGMYGYNDLRRIDANMKDVKVEP